MGASAEKKFQALEQFIKDNSVTGLEMIGDDNTKIARSFFLIEGQQLPMGVVMNDTIYTYIQVIVAPKVKEDRQASVNAYLNTLNEQFPMLKYHIDGASQVVLTCSVPADDDSFNPALIFALIDQVQGHLVESYADMMKELWGEAPEVKKGKEKAKKA